MPRRPRGRHERRVDQRRPRRRLAAGTAPCPHRWSRWPARRARGEQPSALTTAAPTSMATTWSPVSKAPARAVQRDGAHRRHVEAVVVRLLRVLAEHHALRLVQAADELLAPVAQRRRAVVEAAPQASWRRTGSPLPSPSCTRTTATDLPRAAPRGRRRARAASWGSEARRADCGPRPPAPAAARRGSPRAQHHAPPEPARRGGTRRPSAQPRPSSMAAEGTSTTLRQQAHSGPPSAARAARDAARPPRPASSSERRDDVEQQRVRAELRRAVVLEVLRLPRNTRRPACAGASGGGHSRGGPGTICSPGPCTSGAATMGSGGMGKIPVTSTPSGTLPSQLAGAVSVASGPCSHCGSR